MARCYVYESGPESAAWRWRVTYDETTMVSAQAVERLLGQDVLRDRDVEGLRIAIVEVHPNSAPDITTYEVVLPRVQVRLQRAT